MNDLQIVYRINTKDQAKWLVGVDGWFDELVSDQVRLSK